MIYMDEYKRWCELATDDGIKEVLGKYSQEQIEDAFYRNLSFGTGGLRGIIGAGTNRINVYTVAKASQGLANYLIERYGKRASVSIGYDSRIKSDLFAKTAAEVFAANGVAVFLWSKLNPVPALSFSIRHLKTSAGVMITASHNPSKYNGYKVYSDDGCQITTEAAEEILTEIEKIDIFEDVKRTSFLKAVETGTVKYIDEQVLTAYINEVKNQSVLFGDEVDTNVAIVYSPLNGTGYIPVTRTLSEMGYTNITLVEEQRLPDGEFPTCPYPNPENNEALDLGLKYCKKIGADLVLATDPDCDRVGIAVKDTDGEYVLLSGNEVGVLLLEYICSQRQKHKKMPVDPVMIKTIVSTDLGTKIAENYGVKTVNVLTGFKFIGEQIGVLEKYGKEKSYIFGFEESYGYLSGDYVRDKDAVNGAYLICEMFAYYKTRGISLIQKLNELFDKYGYHLNTLYSFEFEGSSGFIKMQNIMKNFRDNVGEGCLLGDNKIITVLDYVNGIDKFPKSDVIKYVLEDSCSVVVRPSGTEPKLKTYISVSAPTKENAELVEKAIVNDLRKFFM